MDVGAEATAARRAMEGLRCRHRWAGAAVAPMHCGLDRRGGGWGDAGDRWLPDTGGVRIQIQALSLAQRTHRPI